MKSTAEVFSEIRATMGDSWLPAIYQERILRLRTRSYDFPPASKLSAPRIHHTLLGVELVIGRRRLLCPDLATARYLAVFARAGARSVAIPYEINRISLIADELESSWHRMLLLAESLTADLKPAFRTRLGNLLIAKVRQEIAAAGSGPRIPEFKRSTKQRSQ